MRREHSIPALVRAIAMFATGILIFVGLPLVGWGLGDVSGFFQEPARLVYALAAAIAQSVIVVQMPMAGKNRAKVDDKVARHRWSLMALQLLPTLMMLVGPFCDRRGILVIGRADVWRWVGLTLYVVGFGLMHWAEAMLDKSFTVDVALLDDHKLVTTGLYRWIRHPRYLGIILFDVAIALVFRSWLGLVIATMILALLVWRCLDEDKMLQDAFGETWEAWAAKSWRLVPWVW